MQEVLGFRNLPDTPYLEPRYSTLETGHFLFYWVVVKELNLRLYIYIGENPTIYYISIYLETYNFSNYIGEILII